MFGSTNQSSDKDPCRTGGGRGGSAPLSPLLDPCMLVNVIESNLMSSIFSVFMESVLRDASNEHINKLYSWRKHKIGICVAS